MMLNPRVCLRGRVGQISGLYGKSTWIEANSKKINALLEMCSPKKPKEVMSLTGRMAALSHFVSRATDRCAPFFDVLKRSKKFEWMEKCEQAFLALKEHDIIKANRKGGGEMLYLCLTIFEKAVIAALVR